MSIVDEVIENWDIIVDNFDGLCVHTIFNTKVLVINADNRHGTGCSGYVNIMTMKGEHILRYPGKSIIDSFEVVRTKTRLLRDLLLTIRKEGVIVIKDVDYYRKTFPLSFDNLEDADNDPSKSEPQEVEIPIFNVISNNEVNLTW